MYFICYMLYKCYCYLLYVIQMLLIYYVCYMSYVIQILLHHVSCTHLTGIQSLQAVTWLETRWSRSRVSSLVRRISRPLMTEHWVEGWDSSLSWFLSAGEKSNTSLMYLLSSISATVSFNNSSTCRAVRSPPSENFWKERNIGSVWSSLSV